MITEFEWEWNDKQHFVSDFRGFCIRENVSTISVVDRDVVIEDDK
jgi:hypothetical protein